MNLHQDFVSRGRMARRGLYSVLILLGFALSLANGQTLINGNRKFQGTLDFSDTRAKLIPPSAATDPSGACTDREMVYSISSGAWFQCDPTSHGWVKQQTGGASLWTTRLNQLSSYNLSKAENAAFVEDVIQDYRNSVPGPNANSYGKRYRYWALGGLNKQCCKDTAFGHTFEGTFDRGQKFLMRLIHNGGAGDDSAIEAQFYKHRGTTAGGDEGGRFERVILSGASAGFGQLGSGGLAPRSNCAATQTTSAITPAADGDQAHPQGVQLSSFTVDSAAGCAAGDLLILDPVATINDSPGNGAQEIIKVVSVTGNTLTGYAKIAHTSGAKIERTRQLLPVYAQQWRDGVYSDGLLINMNPAKQYTAGTATLTDFTEVTINGGTVTPTMFGGTAQWPGVCVSFDADNGGFGGARNYRSWLEARSITGNKLVFAVGHRTPFTASNYIAAPCTRVLGLDTDISLGDSRHTSVILRDQPLTTGYEFAGSDPIHFPDDSYNSISLAHILNESLFPNQQVAGWWFDPQTQSPFGHIFDMSDGGNFTKFQYAGSFLFHHGNYAVPQLQFLGRGYRLPFYTDARAVMTQVTFATPDGDTSDFGSWYNGDPKFHCWTGYSGDYCLGGAHKAGSGLGIYPAGSQGPIAVFDSSNGVQAQALKVWQRSSASGGGVALDSAWGWNWGVEIKPDVSGGPQTIQAVTTAASNPSVSLALKGANGGGVKLPELAGAGSAFACLDAAGKLYRCDANKNPVP